MRELTPTQADDLYELINERTGRSLILTSNRSPVDWYPRWVGHAARCPGLGSFSAWPPAEPCVRVSPHTALQ